MADRIKGITVEIGGNTTGLSKALSGVNKEISSTQKSLKDVEKLLKLDPTNVTLLEQKSKLLASQLGSTSDKLKQLKQAEEQLKNNGIDENSEQFMNLEREIAATEIAMQNLQQQAEETDAKLANTGASANEAAEGVQEQGEAAEESSKANEILKKSLAVVATTFATVTAAAAAAVSQLAKFLGSATKEAAQFADEINTEAAVTGIAVDKLQEFHYMADLVDVSVDTLTGSMRKNIQAMGNAARGQATYTEAYEKLGVAIYDANGNLRDSEEVFWESIDLLGKMENETERDALAMQLFSRSAQQINPIIKAGSDKMKDLADEAHRVGYVLNEDTLAAYNNFQDSSDRLTAGAKAAKNALGGILLPVMQDLADEGVGLLADFTNGIKNANGDLNEMGDVLGEILTRMFDKIGSYMPQIIELAGTIIQALGSALMKNADKISKSAVNVVKDLCKSFSKALPQVAKIAGDIIVTLVNGIVSSAPELAAAAVGVMSSLIGSLGEALPELIPAITAGVIQVAESLIENLPVLISALVTIMKGLAVGLIEALPIIIEMLPSLIDSIVSGVIECLPVLLDMIIQIGIAITKKLPEIVVMIVKQIPDILSTIGSTLGKNAGVLWEGLKKSFADTVNFWIGMFESFINLIVKGINSGIIDNLNKLSFKMPDWLGGKSFGFNINHLAQATLPKVPYMATGGTINKGSAIVGEAGAELLTITGGAATVTPLTGHVAQQNISSALNEAQPAINVNVEFSGSLGELARLLQPEIEAEYVRLGV